MKKYLLILMTMLLSATAQAESLHYNIISLSASAEKTVARDTMRVVFSIEEMGKNRQEVSNQTTTRSNRVIQAARQNRALKAELSSRNTYSYTLKNQKNTLQWQDSATITVVSSDFGALEKFIAQVQKYAAVQSLSFYTSRQKQSKMEEDLIQQAIQAFRKKAQSITQALGKKQYQIVEMSIDQQHNHAPMMYRTEGVMLASAKAATPDTEAGEESLRLQVSGRIQVQ